MDAIDKATLERAFARLDAKPGHVLTCGGCGHSAPVPSDPEKSVYKCDVCGAHTRFGAEQARVTIVPNADRRFVDVRMVSGHGARERDVTVTFEREYGAAVALELLSVTMPAQHRAFQAMLRAVRDVPGAPRGSGDASLELDAAPPKLPKAERDPGPAAVVREPGDGRCGCGEPSALANGACRGCALAAIGGV